MKGIRNIGTYYYDDPLEKRNGEVDIALEKNKGFDIVEVKYLKNRLDRSAAEKEIGQIRQISELDVDKIGFISVSGFEEGIKADYLISGEDLYHI